MPKNLYLVRKISKNWTYFAKILEFFREIILKCQFLWNDPIVPERFQMNSKFLKKVQNGLDREGQLELA